MIKEKLILLEKLLEKYSIRPCDFWDNIPNQYKGLIEHHINTCKDIEKYLINNGYV